MSTPKALAAQIVLNKIKDIIDTEEYRMISEMDGFKPSAVRQKLAALHNGISKENKLKDHIDEV